MIDESNDRETPKLAVSGLSGGAIRGFEAIYENGAFRPLEHVEFREGERVRLVVNSDSPDQWSGYGTMEWSGDVATLRCIAMSHDVGAEGDEVGE